MPRDAADSARYAVGVDIEDALIRLRAYAGDVRAMGATSLYLYGSMARNDAKIGSDVDLFIDYDASGRFNALDLVGIKQFLEDKLGSPVDLTTRDGLHPRLRTNIERSAVQIF